MTVLTQRLSRLRKAKNTAQPVVGKDLSQSSGAMPSAEEHNPTLPSVLDEGAGVNIMGQIASQAEGDEPQSPGPTPSTPAQDNLPLLETRATIQMVSSTPSGYLREEYQAVLREVLLEGVGCFDKQKRLLCQKVTIDRDLVMQVDELIDQEWQSDEQTFWRLNCIVYASAVVVERKSRKSPGQQCGNWRLH